MKTACTTIFIADTMTTNCQQTEPSPATLAFIMGFAAAYSCPESAVPLPGFVLN
ncbi:MAG: hypothetical protein LBR81_02505 [Prevotellaceae bacterium]|jgi:hypothetical protein|nr:hypothetical protein [Prevotellaceae bacterium]